MAAVNRVQDFSHHVGDVARETYDHLRHAASDYLSHGRSGMSDLSHTVQTSVRQHPVRWLLIGIGVGCLISAAVLDV